MKQSKQKVVFFNTGNIINLGGFPVDLSSPAVMGILNVTPDSFYDGGKFTQEKAIIKQAGKLLAEGALLIDIGAQSTRPGSRPVSTRTELNRLLPAIDAVKNKFPSACISIDTSRAQVAEKAVRAGAVMINDVSGGDDPDMFHTIASLQVPYVLMHIRGAPATMQHNPEYDDVTGEVFSTLLMKVSMLRALGVHDIITDPGFGFGKTVSHNYRLLHDLPVFRQLGCPVLAGISRKSMICRVLGVKPADALNGTTALNMAALMKGASILRVHDVQEAVETVKLYRELRG